MFSTLENRFKYLAEISEKIQKLDLLDDLNIFVFGSYITDRFKPGESDIDIAIFSESLMDYLNIHELLKIEFSKVNLDSDIFRIYENIPSSVYYEALNSPVQFTTYYPQKLIDFKQKCLERKYKSEK